MTTQELQYAYWQRQHQQQLYRAYRAAAGNQTPGPGPQTLIVHAIKDGQELTSDDIKLENIRYDEGAVERTLSYNCPWQFAHNQELTLKASATNGMKFDHWEDSSRDAERPITMDQEYELSAYFSERR